MKTKEILGSIEFGVDNCLLIEGFDDYYKNYQIDTKGICAKDARIAELKKLAAFYLEEKE